MIVYLLLSRQFTTDGLGQQDAGSATRQAEDDDSIRHCAQSAVPGPGLPSHPAASCAHPHPGTSRGPGRGTTYALYCTLTLDNNNY